MVIVKVKLREMKILPFEGCKKVQVCRNTIYIKHPLCLAVRVDWFEDILGLSGFTGQTFGSLFRATARPTPDVGNSSG